MPYFSVVVLAYNVAEYLPACLDSLVAQTFEDWEAIVVVDASPDNSADVARSFAGEDSRFRVIDKAENEGTHLARRSGTLVATGEWVTYLDGDDEFTPNALKDLHEALEDVSCDLLRFGVVVEQAGASAEACESCEAYANRPLDPCTGRESLRLTFEENGGYRQDWRAWSNVVKTPIAQEAFRAMTTNRLGRSQDCYEFFVMLSGVHRQVTRTDIRGYRYFYGRGVSGAQKLSADKFVSYVGQFASVFRALDEYADGFAAFDVHLAAEGARIKMTEILFNDWRNRVDDAEKLEAARRAVDALGPDAVAAELERIVRDVAYECWVQDINIADGTPVLAWHSLACELAGGKEPSKRYQMFSTAAETHLRDVAERRKNESCASRIILNAIAPKQSRRRNALSSLREHLRR